jgi:hypothetical protein
LERGCVFKIALNNLDAEPLEFLAFALIDVRRTRGPTEAPVSVSRRPVSSPRRPVAPNTSVFIFISFRRKSPRH